ncbi:MAG: sugar transferase [Bacteroidetes bacterium]|nr:sugar transferase [Bacteroidota bacterium]
MYLSVKRWVDFSASLIGLLILLPIFLVICIILSVTGDGAIFYLQERVGYKQRKFHIYKFSSMLKDSINMGSKTVTLRNDPRITKFGRYLRITKINELPQIINVLIGDMSLVGARPLIPNSFKKYSQSVQTKIYQTRPGITGIGSLIFRDEEKLVSEVRNLGYEPLDYYAKFIYPYKGELEVWYQDNISLALDVKIVGLTFYQIIFPKSNLTFKLIKGLPERNKILTVKGLKSVSLDDDFDLKKMG